MPEKKLPIAVLISGTGRSLHNLIEKIHQGTLDCEIRLVISSSKMAKGLQYAEEANIPLMVIEQNNYTTRQEFSSAVFAACRDAKVDYVAMAGYMKLLYIPPDFINRVLNIHPSLIPSFSGKGYYGNIVHQKAMDYGVKISGCTVHFVDNEYDAGPVILQKPVPVLENDTVQALNDRVFYEAECIAYPETLQLIAQGRVSVEGRRVHIAEKKP